MWYENMTGFKASTLKELIQKIAEHYSSEEFFYEGVPPNSVPTLKGLFYDNDKMAREIFVGEVGLAQFQRACDNLCEEIADSYIDGAEVQNDIRLDYYSGRTILPYI